MKKYLFLISAIIFLSACGKQTNEWTGFYFPEKITLAGIGGEKCEVKEFATNEICQEWLKEEGINEPDTYGFCGFQCTWNSSCQYSCMEQKETVPKKQSNEKKEWLVLTHPLTNWSIKIPKDWESEIHNSETLSIAPKIDPKIGIGEIVFSVYQNSEKLEEKEFFKGKDLYIGGNVIDRAVSSEEVEINGLKGTKYNQVGAKFEDGTAIHLYKDDYIIEFYDIGNKNQENGIFDKIVNSLSFYK